MYAFPQFAACGRSHVFGERAAANAILLEQLPYLLSAAAETENGLSVHWRTGLGWIAGLDGRWTFAAYAECMQAARETGEHQSPLFKTRGGP